MTTSTPALLHLLGIAHPLIQAPMVGVSTPALAAAVSNAGALGSIGLGALKAEGARQMLAATRALTARPFQVNLFCHRPAVHDAAREAAWAAHMAPLFAEFGAAPPATLACEYGSFLEQEDTLEMLLAERPAVASFTFGLPPKDWIAAMRAQGIVTVGSVTTAQEAVLAQQAGVDAILAQGYEAGGHRTVFDPQHDEKLDLATLLSRLRQDCTLPVIAAGGIMNGQAMAAAMRLGAAGVQLGTAFIACPESSANAAFRAALHSARARDTRVCATISGRAARGMANRLFTDIGGSGAPPMPDYPIAYAAAKALHAAASAHANNDFAVQWAGQGAALARHMPAAALVRVLVDEYAAAAAL